MRQLRKTTLRTKMGQKSAMAQKKRVADRAPTNGA